MLHTNTPNDTPLGGIFQCTALDTHKQSPKEKPRHCGVFCTSVNIGGLHLVEVVGVEPTSKKLGTEARPQAWSAFCSASTGVRADDPVQGLALFVSEAAEARCSFLFRPSFRQAARPPIRRFFGVRYRKITGTRLLPEDQAAIASSRLSLAVLF